MIEQLNYIQPIVKRQVERYADDIREKLCATLRMERTVKIHASKSPHRLHFIPEWAAKRGIRQVDIVENLNVDKGTVSKWFSGKAFPTQDNFMALADLFELDEPTRIFSHPDDDWLKRLFDNRSAEERERIIRTIETAFPEQPRPASGKKVA